MITVSILINGQPIFTRSARNQGETNEKGDTIYVTDADEIVLHKRDRGAIALAIKLLRTINEKMDKKK